MTDLGLVMRLLQLGDSAFPVGAFSFSNGLEAAVQQAVVRDAETLAQFVRTATEQSAACDGIALLAAHRAARDGDRDGVIRADRALFRRKLNEEMRTMTVRMGQKLGEVASHAADLPLVDGVARGHPARRGAGHLSGRPRRGRARGSGSTPTRPSPSSSTAWPR